MFRQVKPVVLATLVALLALALWARPALAIPGIPMQFFGNVFLGASPAPDGTLVEAKIGGVTYKTTTTLNGQYGYAPLFKFPGDDDETAAKEGGAPDDTIALFVGGVQVATATFNNGAVKKLDLTVPSSQILTIGVAASPDPALVGETVTASGVVTNLDGLPIAGAEVHITWGDGASSDTTTAAGGVFSATHAYAAAATYTITAAASLAGYLSASATDTVAVITPPQLTVTLQVTPDPVQMGKTVTGAGKVTGPDGQGVVGVAVSINWGDGTAVDNTTTDAGGNYSGTHVYALAATYTVTATATKAGYASGTATDTVRVTVLPPLVVTLQVSPDPAYVGQVVTAAGAVTAEGQGVADAAVLVIWGDGTPSTNTTTDAQGNYTATHTYATPATYTVTAAASKTGFDSGSITDTVTVVLPALTVTLDVTPDPVQMGKTVTGAGKVTDPQGQGVVGVAVSINWGDGTAADDTATDAQGNYSGTHVYGAANTYTVTATASKAGYTSGSATDTVRVTVLPPLVVTLQVTPDPALVGQEVTAAGVVTAEGQGVADAAVLVIWGDGTPSTNTTTDAQGNYTATHTYATPATYTVTAAASKAGFDSGSATDTVTVVLPALTVTLDVTPDPVQMGKTVTGAGKVTGPDGQGVVGVAVSINWGDGTAADDTATDAGGNYSGTHVYAAANTYTVTATATKAGYATGTATDTVRVTVLPPLVVTLQVTPDPAYVGQVVTAAGVVTAEGQAVADAAVRIIWGDGTVPTDVTTDAQGNYSATHTYTAVSTPTYTVTATATKAGYDPGSATDTVTVVLPALTVTLDVTPDPVQMGKTVTGAGKVTGPDGQGVVGVAVSINWGDGTAADDTTTDAQGNYSGTHVYAAAATYTVTATASKAGYDPGSATDTVRVTVLPPLTVTLQVTPDPVQVGQTVTGAGKVTDPDGQPVEGAAVLVIWGDGTPSTNTTTDAQGNYTATHTYATPATYTVTATATKVGYDPGSATDTVQVTLLPPLTVTLGVTPASALTGATITASGSVTGSGPVADAAVHITWGDGTFSDTTTNAQGNYSATHFYTAANTYTVTATASKAGFADGSATGTVTISAPPSIVILPTLTVTLEVTPETVQMGQTVTGAGRVTSAGAPISGASVSLNWGDGTPLSTATTDGAGNYSATHIYATPGTYTVTAAASASGYTSGFATDTVTITALPPLTVTLQVTPDPAQVGQVVTGAGQVTSVGAPISGASVSLNWGDGTPLSAATTDAAGNYSATHTYAAAGTYTVTATATKAGYAAGTATDTVTVAVPPTPMPTLTPTPTPTPTPTVLPTPTPTPVGAAIRMTDLRVSPRTAGPGDLVEVRVKVSNVGGAAGTYTVTFTVAGTVEGTASGSLNPGATTELFFTTSRQAPGTYAITVDGLFSDFTVVAPVAVELPTQVTITAATTTAVDELGNVLALTGDTVTTQTVDGVLQFTLPVALLQGRGLTSFKDETSGIEVIGNLIRIPVRDAQGNIQMWLEAETEGFIGTGTTAVARVTKLTLRTKEQAVDLSSDDPTLGKVAFSFKADLKRIPQGAKLEIITKKTLPSDAQAVFELLAREADGTVADIGAVIEIKRENLVNGIDVGAVTMTMKVGAAWVAKNGGVERIKMGHLADDGTREFLDTTFVGTDEEGRMIFEAVSPGGFSFFAIMAIAPRPAAFVLGQPLIEPGVVGPGEQVKITVTVTNRGATAGVYRVILTIDDKPENSQTVSLDPGASTTVIFFVKRDKPGTYRIAVDGQRGEFTVREVAPTPTPTPTVVRPTPTPVTPTPTPTLVTPTATPTSVPLVVPPKPFPGWAIGVIVVLVLLVAGVAAFMVIRRRRIKGDS